MRSGPMVQRTVLVVGATGTQGGAVAEALLREDEVEVHALTRNPSSEPAEALDRAGATVVEGDLADRDRLRELLAAVDAAFGVTDFWEHGYETEVEHGVNLAEAADEAGLEHLVFSSVGGADRDTGIAHFDSKFEVEERIRELDLPATILRPVFFMQNFEGMREAILDGTLAMALAPGTPLQMVDAENLGELAARALDEPERYVGEAIEVAGDELTLQATAARFADLTGVPVRGHHLSLEELREAMGEEYETMFRWFNEAGYEADLTALRADHDVAFTRLEAYLEREGWAKPA